MQSVSFRESIPCPQVVWETKDHGLCNVAMCLFFDDLVNVSVPVAKAEYSFCNITMNANTVKYKTVVYFTSGDITQKISQNEDWSDAVPLLRITTKAPKITTKKSSKKSNYNYLF